MMLFTMMLILKLVKIFRDGELFLKITNHTIEL
jgi:hypothetical protein